ncbi:MAG: GntR family transcriptional regulator [Acidimicrobiia bacterium]
MNTAADKRLSTSDEAARHIRRMIFNGDVAPGARIPQDEVAEALGISRIPVREALIGLERDGLVTIELYRGAFVTPIDADTIIDHYALYGLTFAFAARRAIERSDRSSLSSDLRAVLAALKATDDTAEFTRLAVQFNQTVVRASRSARVKTLLQSLSGIVPGDFFTSVPAAMPAVRRGLQQVAKAIAAGDIDAAATAYHRQYAHVADEAVNVFAERGLLASDQATNGGSS